MIESSRQFSKRIGNNALKIFIKQLDPLPKERRKTKAEGKRLVLKYGNKCAVCGREKIEYAHIIPLAMGGITTEDNIVLLCSAHHSLYDKGGLSIGAMQKYVMEWKGGVTNPQFESSFIKEYTASQTAIAKPPEKLVDLLKDVRAFQTVKHYCKAIALINKELSNIKHNDVEINYLRIKKAELNRRRAAKGVLNEALKELKQINLEKLSHEYIPLFCYEIGYICRLLGRHTEAANYYKLSAKTAMSIIKNGKPDVLGYVSASAMRILCLLAKHYIISKNEASRFIDKVKKLENICSEQGEYWGYRWRLNCVAIRLQVHLKANDSDMSWKALNDLREIHYNIDIKSGWDLVGNRTITKLEGITRARYPKTEKDLIDGIGLLSRSFKATLGTSRPEGIRDIGFELINALKKNGYKYEFIDNLEAVLNDTVDGTSVLWPYIALE